MKDEESPPGDRVNGGDRISVLHIGKYFVPHRGGMETFLRDLMVEQQRQGLDVAAIVHASERGFRSRLDDAGKPGATLPIVRVARWFTFAFAPISPTFPLLLGRCVRERQPDILHIHMPNLSPFWCLLMPATRRIPWVVHWHADVLTSEHSALLRHLYRLYRPFERAMLNRAARIVVTSPPYLESSEALANYSARCTVVPLGIDCPPARGSGRQTTPGRNIGEELRVLFVGRLTYYKGLAYLIEAVAATEKLTLWVVGEGEEETALKSKVAALGMEDRIRFLGNLSDERMGAELEACDCLCLPSIERTEAFGVVLLEAMRAAKAVVATRVRGSGMGWLVRHGETGLLVDPENRDALARALVQLRDDRDLCERLGRAGRSRLYEQFSIQRSASLLTEIYRA